MQIVVNVYSHFIKYRTCLKNTFGIKIGSNSRIYRQVIPKSIRAIGNVSGVISLGAVGYEVFHYSNVKSSNVIDAAMGAISFVPGWGWIAGGIYFGADIVTKLSTGKSIVEHLDAAIEERYDIDNGILLEWKYDRLYIL